MRTRAVLAAVTMSLLAACGTNTAAGSDVVGTGKSADYGFSGTTLDGRAFDGDVLKGKPAVLWFWAPWCPTCRAQSGNVSALSEKYDGRVAVVAVGGLDSGTAIQDAAGRIPHVTHLLDPQGEVWQHFRVTAQSTFRIISAEGEIIAEGYLEDADLNDLVARLAG